MIITDLKQGVKNPNRVNVFVNGKYVLSLDVAQVVELGVKIGLKISSERLAELKRASEFGKLYQRALEKALTRPHSEREIRDYLMRKLKRSSSETFAPVVAQASSEDPLQLSQEIPGGLRVEYSEFSEEILAQLVSKGYVDDRRFAEFWVENRFVKKGVSRRRLKMELMKKGVAREIIDEVLDGRNDEEELRKMIAKKRAKYSEPEKLMAYLVRQGFSYDLVRKMVMEENED